MDDLGLDAASKAILMHFEKDVMEVQRVYMELKDTPPVDRDMPPLSGGDMTRGVGRGALGAKAPPPSTIFDHGLKYRCMY